MALLSARERERQRDLLVFVIARTRVYLSKRTLSLRNITRGVNGR